MTKFIDVLISFKESPQEEVTECIAEKCGGDDSDGSQCKQSWVFTIYENIPASQHYHLCASHLREAFDLYLQDIMEFHEQS